MDDYKFNNKLIFEKSPYLLQHAHNPVNWYPWGNEAFEKALKEDKPIFLSIGYSTCHWCHVMERESFEDNEVARILNENFISIKVDREERPDIDSIYMKACQEFFGQGGWPLTVFLTPDKKPFFAGTYFPKEDRMGMSGIVSLLNQVIRMWNTERDKLVKSGEKITEMLNDTMEAGRQELSSNIAQQAYKELEHRFDDAYGGFGSAPKFPTPQNLLLLMAFYKQSGEKSALDMAEKTLDSMLRGGIFDHVGFGFSRYSTDRKWLVPHFEKMLYDNALLIIAYTQAYLITKNEVYEDTAKKVINYVLRDMVSNEGGFYSAEDADSEGEEGKFYVWSKDEIFDVLGPEDGEFFSGIYNITFQGNFEGKNILNHINNGIPAEENDRLEQCRIKLYQYREKRVHPHKDDKILTAWNGLMISALAIAGKAFNNPAYIRASEQAFFFIESRLYDKNGRLLARYRNDHSAFPAYLDDYAFLSWGLVELYYATYKPVYLKKAIQSVADMNKLFWDYEAGGYYLYGSDSEQLISRPKEIYDGAMPSGNSVAAYVLVQLAKITRNPDYEKKAGLIFSAFSKEVESFPPAHCFLLLAWLIHQIPSNEVIIVEGRNRDIKDKMLQEIKKVFDPFIFTIISPGVSSELDELIPGIENYIAIDGKTTAYICKNFSCQSPVNDFDEFMKKLPVH